MNTEQSIFDLIERYHLGILSEEEQKTVELRMHTDPAFADYVKFNGFANDIIHTAGLDLLRTQMNADLVKLEQKRILRNRIVGAGLFILVAGLAILLFKNFTRTNEQKKLNLPDPKQEVETTEPLTDNMNKRSEIIRAAPQHNNSKQHKNEILSNRSVLSGEKNETEPSIEVPSVSTNERTTETSQERKEFSENPIQEELKKDCHLSFEAVIELACEGERNGSIVIEPKRISGGSAPYSFRISEKNQDFPTGIFSELAKGTYTVTLTDSRACSHSKEISVFEKSCGTSKAFSFNPEYGEKWAMPIQENSGTYEIYSRTGTIVKTGIFAAHTTLEWDGTNAVGMPMDAGVYVCTVHYSKGKKEIIELSVVR